MKKKLLFGLILPLFAAVIAVSAVTFGYFFVGLVTVDVNQPIEIVGDLSQSVNCDAGETCLGTSIVVTNTGTTDIEINITDDYGLGDFVVTYVDGSNVEFTNPITITAGSSIEVFPQFVVDKYINELNFPQDLTITIK
jgi:hypothetical protein